mmetsp:Transcript_7377/g.14786  ORF Transcript_7377/g.14786 Transcript_7377/m.14786 type:complete len:221 (+) Transcript_7377:432-1094(+)|eukprot:CAMPEP_0118807560 /NCGR_PEP_ID=MMETSP1161-20130426/35537_1 /TAXON_ID=249345 /ORGANISM="Picochlorum oklahomensis, Strain CCMP2329" /LENGTH=220 /DNA_ID=CAMNT_0006736933 /DNA_START=1159 /DNA_END=1821 /DNA_ORIENTATION=+
MATGEEKTYIYYCKYSGNHALTTNVNLATAQRRRTDHSLIIDTQGSGVVVKLYAKDGVDVVYVKRENGGTERQYRVMMDDVPIGYRTEPHGNMLYIFDDALTTYATVDAMDGEDMPPVPPCIAYDEGRGCTRVTLQVVDGGKKQAVLKISADSVCIQLKESIISNSGIDELMEYVREMLGVSLGRLGLQQGHDPREKFLHVTGMGAVEVFDRLRAHLKNE